MPSLPYQAVNRDEMTQKDAGRRLSYLRGLRTRPPADRVGHGTAWKAAGPPGWPDMPDAGYVVLTRLQADALITLDRQLADAVTDLVTAAPVQALS